MARRWTQMLVGAGLAAAFGLGWPDRASTREHGAPARNLRPHVVAPLAGQPTTTAATGARDSSAIAEGARLFTAYNCADCHGADGSGAMGPSFQDNRWRFGGSAAELTRSIADGRPEGMPAWGPLVPADHIRKMVAYIETLGNGKDVTTENFTGETVPRAGR